jgi:predicted NBD/HSP70 family sugar kinase
VNAVNLNWRNLPLGQLLTDRYGLPASVLNDSQAAAIGEHTFGDGYRADESLVVVNVGHGIGAGIILNGQLFHGDGGGAGEIGHVAVSSDAGQRCRCGNVGCLETLGQHPRPGRASARGLPGAGEAPYAGARRDDQLRRAGAGVRARQTRSRARSSSTPAASWARPSRA